MTHDLKIYIKQPDVLTSTTYVKKYYGPHSYKPFSLDSMPENVVKSNTVTVVNSMNPWLDAFWQQENLDSSILSSWRQTNKKIIAIEWQLMKPLADVVETDIELDDESDTNVYTDYLYRNNPDQDLFAIASKDSRITNFITAKYLSEDETDLTLDETVVKRRYWPIFNIQGDFIYGNVGDNSIHKYRVYLGDRLLTERFYPVESGGEYQVVESISLSDGVEGALRIESSYGLVIDKIEVDGLTVSVNDITYDLLLS